MSTSLLIAVIVLAICCLLPIFAGFGQKKPNVWLILFGSAEMFALIKILGDLKELLK
jgi:hypothetical protein